MSEKLHIYENTREGQHSLCIDGHIIAWIGAEPGALSNCHCLVSDFNAMQSELEALRPKCKAFDWLEKHGEKVLTFLDENGQVVVCFPGTPYDGKGRAATFQLAIEDFIAKHGTNIPDKGDTMETKIEMRNVLEIRNVTENEIALFFDGDRCSGDHHSKGAFGKTYLKLADYIASLESRLAEAQTLLEGKDKTEHDLKVVSESLLKYEHRVAELEELARSNDKLPLPVAYALNNAVCFLAREKGESDG